MFVHEMTSTITENINGHVTKKVTTTYEMDGQTYPSEPALNNAREELQRQLHVKEQQLRAVEKEQMQQFFQQKMQQQELHFHREFEHQR